MKTFKKYYKLYAAPSDVYNALTNPIMLEIWTGEKAIFEAEPNTDFSLWDGAIIGKNIKFEMDKLVQQIWYFDEMESKVTFKLHAEKKFTNVELTHENIPDEAYENMTEGWDFDFFGALEELFNN
ncbi:MAG TPA: SRPBCC domain-containing protein [Prolixibacteraceae bacterium]|nr:SRPBCC domain-containing protein [Prolixibacteraceae bacterium]